MELFLASLTFGFCIFASAAVCVYYLKECNKQMCDAMKTIAVLKAAPDMPSAKAMLKEKKEKEEEKPKPQMLSPDELSADALQEIRKRQSLIDSKRK